MALSKRKAYHKGWLIEVVSEGVRRGVLSLFGQPSRHGVVAQTPKQMIALAKALTVANGGEIHGVR